MLGRNLKYVYLSFLGLLLLAACTPDMTPSVTVPSGPKPLLDTLPEILELETQVGETAQKRFELKNENEGAISFSASVPLEDDWLSVSPADGVLEADSTVILTLNATCATRGTFESVFTLNIGAERAREFAVVLECRGGAATDNADSGDETSDTGTPDDGADGGTDGGTADGGEDSAADGSDDDAGEDDTTDAGTADTDADGADADGADSDDTTTDDTDTGGTNTGDGADDGGADGNADGGATGEDEADTDAGTDGEDAGDGADTAGDSDTGEDGDTGEETDGANGSDDGAADTGGADGGETAQAKLANLSATKLELNTQPGNSIAESISFSNAGNAALEYQLTQTSRETFLSFANAAGTLQPGQGDEIIVTATCPQDSDNLQSVLNLQTNDPERKSVTIEVELVCVTETPDSVTLSIGAQGPAKGRITSQPPGIDCLGSEGDCVAEFAGGDSVVLSAAAPDNAQFMGWLDGPCAGLLGKTCELELESDTDINVNFTSKNPNVYNISLRYSDDELSATQRRIVERAAQRWSQVITADLPDRKAADVVGLRCPSDVVDYSGFIDDLVISVSAPAIDGVNGLSAEAGPCHLRDNNLPYFGAVQIDAADLDRLESEGLLEALVLHEIGHVLGLGTLWDSSSFLAYDAETCAAATMVDYTGDNALTEYQAYGGEGRLAAEDEGASSTKCVHWSEAAFQNELMTGFLGDGAAPMSRITIAALEDLGYSVNYAAADSYELPDPAAIRTASLDPDAEISERLILPESLR